MASSPTLLTPTSKPTTLLVVKTRPITTIAAIVPRQSLPHQHQQQQQHKETIRRHFLTLSASMLSPPFLSPLSPAFASSDEEYVKDTEEVITKVRTTITLDKNDPNVANAVADLRDASNTWVSKYRREKALLGRASFRDIYSALNAVSGHYISFGPAAPIPAKRKARILEEMDTAEKALKRGR